MAHCVLFRCTLSLLTAVRAGFQPCSLNAADDVGTEAAVCSRLVHITA